MSFHKIEFIHQVLITDSGRLPIKIPKFLKENIASVKKVYPKAKYKIWSSNEIRVFLKKNFSVEVLEAYDLLVPYSFKADLARFALLYVYGGLYVDLGVRTLRPWNIPLHNDIAAFRDVSFVSKSWGAIQTGLLWGLPKREEFSLAIDWIVENCRNLYYGANPLYPTGPVLLGRVFLKVMAMRGNDFTADNQYVGSCGCITPESSMINLTYVCKKGEVVAYRNKKQGGDLKHIGLKKSNNYNEIWNNRQVYSEKIRVWSGCDDMIFIKSGFVKKKEGLYLPWEKKKGMTYGPYVTLEEGNYLLNMAFSGDTSSFKFEISLVSSYSSKRHEKFLIDETFLKDNKIVLPFSVSKKRYKMEFKVRALSGFSGVISKFSIAPASGKEDIFSLLKK